MHIHGAPENRQDHIYLIANAHWEPHEFELPILPGWKWARVVDTGLDPPLDIAEPDEPQILAGSQRYLVHPRSVVALIGRSF